MSNTYKDFAKYLKAVANEFNKYGSARLEPDTEYEELYTDLCQMHNDFDHGADRIEELKRVFIYQCESYGQGWTPIKDINKDK